MNIKTFACALRRVVHSVLLATCTALILGLVIGLTAVLAMHVHQYAGGAVFLVGVLVLALVWWPFVDRRTFLDHAGHIAVLTEYIHTGEIAGNGLFARGQSLVRHRLGEPEDARQALIGVTNTSRKVMNHFDWIGERLPFDIGLLRRLFAWLAKTTGLYMGDVILSYLIIAEEESSVAAEDAICYYVQNAGPLTRTSLRTAWLDKLLGALSWLFWLAVLGGLAWLVSIAVSPQLVSQLPVPAEHADKALIALHIAWGVVCGVPLAWVATWLTHETLIRPILTTIILIRFHALIEGQPLNPTVRDAIANQGDLLRELDSLRYRSQQ